MSLFDGKAELAFSKGRGNNNRNYNGNNNQNQNNGNNRFQKFSNNSNQGNGDSRFQKFPNQSNRSNRNVPSRRFGASEVEAPVRNTDQKLKLDKERTILVNFCDDYTKNSSNVMEIQKIIIEEFADVVDVMKHYYDPKYGEELSGEMNAVLDLMTTQLFASSLISALKQNMIDDWDTTVWRDAAVTLSILLKTSFDKMKEETIQIYTFDILASAGMWKREITKLVNEIGVTEELALDLLIKLPYLPEEWNSLSIRTCYQGFVETILDNAGENSDVLDAECQSKLFDFCFGNGKTALKVIGRCLTSEPRNKFDDTVQSVIYEEYKSMLYTKLDKYDLGDIKFSLRFIADQKKANSETAMVFDPVVASKKDSIRKALMMLINDDATIKEVLS